MGAALRLMVWVAILHTGPAEVLAHEGYDRQIAELSARVNASPRDAALRVRRGELHRLRGEWAAAEMDFSAARRLDPELAPVDLCLASMRLDQGRPGEALAAVGRFLARRPDDPEGLQTRARARLATGDPSGAADDYTRAIERLGPSGAARPEHYLERARALAGTGAARLPEAIAGLDGGLAALGRPVTLDLLAFELEERAGRVDAALRRADAAAARSSRPELWLQRKAGLLERAGRLCEARRAYAAALEAARSLPPARRRSRLAADLEASLLAATRRLARAGP